MRDGAIPTAAARAVYVQESNYVSHSQNAAIHIGDWPASGGDLAHANVARDDGVGDSREATVPEMHVRAAHLAAEGAE